MQTFITHLQIHTHKALYYTILYYGIILCTCSVSVGLSCLKRMSQTFRVPVILVVKKTAGLLGLQQPSVSGVLLYVVHIMGDSFASSDHN